jgi:hypothetical protein
MNNPISKDKEMKFKGDILKCKEQIELYDLIVNFAKTQMNFNEYFDCASMFPSTVGSPKERLINSKWQEKLRMSCIELIQANWFEFHGFDMILIYDTDTTIHKIKLYEPLKLNYEFNND